MRVAVIGLGSIGARYAQWLCEFDQLEVAVHDERAQAARDVAAATGALAFAGVDELLAWSPVAVVVATPPDTHAAIAIQALRSGACVLVEKPFAHDRQDGQRLLEAAQQHAGRMAVVCNMRFHPGPMTIREHLPAIGKPLFARAWFGHSLAQMRPGQDSMAVYAASAQRGGGAILDCIHEIDLQQWMFGEAKLESAVAATLGPVRIPAEDWAEFVLSFPGGVRSSVHLDLLQRHKRRGWQISGTEAALTWTSEGRAPERCEVWLRGRDSEECLLNVPHVDDDEVYRQMLQRFVQSARSDSMDDALQSPEQAMRALTVALEARAGHQQTERNHVDH